MDRMPNSRYPNASGPRFNGVMRYRLLGRSGVRVSEVALGTMTFGEPMSWGVDERTSRQLLEVYAEAGGTFLDTANRYADGNAERIVGDFLRADRDRFVVGTKYTLQTRAGDLNSAGNHRKNLVRSIEQSLRSLGLEYVDLLWVHARETWTPVAEVMRGLDDLVRAGKVLYVGVSDWPAWEIAEASTIADLRGWTPFVGLQSRYNLLDRTPERDLVPMAGAFDLAVVAWGPLAEGRLTGKYLDDRPGRLRDEELVGTVFQHSRGGSDDTVRLVVEIAAEIGCTPAQVAIAWLASRSGNVIPLLGATSVAQLEENLAAVDVRLAEDHARALDEASAPTLGFPHELLRQAGVTAMAYGDQWDAVDDRRTRYRRSMHQ
jgi:aryl-alcohol dehydrogenase-like predicted oxidoreductase